MKSLAHMFCLFALSVGCLGSAQAFMIHSQATGVPGAAGPAPSAGAKARPAAGKGQVRLVPASGSAARRPAAGGLKSAPAR